MKYVNAGHNQPFLLHGRKITALNEGCIGLGMLDELPYVNVGKLTLSPNTTFVLYTDGVVELENKDGEQFGVNRLIENVKAYSTLKMEDMNNILFSKLDEWKGELNFVDDTAVFSCKFF
jgi:sigma-B regulation protein RsbU (phosphoserine phosphatase)